VVNWFHFIGFQGTYTSDLSLVFSLQSLASCSTQYVSFTVDICSCVSACVFFQTIRDSKEEENNIVTAAVKNEIYICQLMHCIISLYIGFVRVVPTGPRS
jgi:hypothetical protein